MESLDERIVPSTFVANGLGTTGISGISGGGTVWHYDSKNGWSQLGNLTGAVALVDTQNQFQQEELFAEASNGVIWEYRFPSSMTYGAFPSGQWVSTGGALVFNSIVTGLDGITGIAGGGTVFNFQDGIGWKQLGNLSGVVTISGAVSPTSGPNEFYAQTANGELYYLKGGATRWVDTKVLLFPGKIKPDGGGVTGIGAQGSVWHYEDTGQFTRVGTMSGVVALTPSFDSHLQGELFAQVADGSIWLATYAVGYPTDYAHARWTPTYARLMPGTIQRGDAGLVGIAGGNVWQYADPGGWSGLAGLGGAIHVASADNYDPSPLNFRNPQSGYSFETFAQLGDGSIWYFSQGTHNWVNTNGYFIG